MPRAEESTFQSRPSRAEGCLDLGPQGLTTHGSHELSFLSPVRPTRTSLSTGGLSRVSEMAVIPYLGGTSLPEGSRPCDER
jgi:hypothetical protein